MGYVQTGEADAVVEHAPSPPRAVQTPPAGVERDEVHAIMEHFGGVAHMAHIPLAYVQRGDAGVAEHAVHVLHVGRVPSAHVQGGKLSVVVEHVVHAGRLAGVPAGHVQFRKAGAVGEYVFETGDLAGVPVGHVQRLQTGAMVEQTARIRQTSGIPCGHVQRLQPGAAAERMVQVENAAHIPPACIQRLETGAALEHETETAGLSEPPVFRVDAGQSGILPERALRKVEDGQRPSGRHAFQPFACIAHVVNAPKLPVVDRRKIQSGNAGGAERFGHVPDLDCVQHVHVHFGERPVIGEDSVHLGQVGGVKIREVHAFQPIVRVHVRTAVGERPVQRIARLDAPVEANGLNVGGVPVPWPILARVQVRQDAVRAVCRRDDHLHVGGDVEQAGARRARRQCVRRHDGRPDLQVG